MLRRPQLRPSARRRTAGPGRWGSRALPRRHCRSRSAVALGWPVQGRVGPVLAARAVAAARRSAGWRLGARSSSLAAIAPQPVHLTRHMRERGTVQMSRTRAVTGSAAARDGPQGVGASAPSAAARAMSRAVVAALQVRSPRAARRRARGPPRGRRPRGRAQHAAPGGHQLPVVPRRPGVHHPRRVPAGLGVRAAGHAGEDSAGRGGLGVPGGGQHDGDRRARVPLERRRPRARRPAGRGVEQRRPSGVRSSARTTWVSGSPNRALNSTTRSPRRGQGQARVEQAAERRAALGASASIVGWTTRVMTSSTSPAGAQGSGA